MQVTEKEEQKIIRIRESCAFLPEKNVKKQQGRIRSIISAHMATCAFLPKIPQSIYPSEPLKHHIAAQKYYRNLDEIATLQPPIPRHSHTLSRSVFLKQAQHQHYGHQYSRRKSNNHASTSSLQSLCQVKGVRVHDEKLPFK
ncbi:hypothetical protein QQ045_032786 [Rhodiola kirilowii]